MENYYMKQILLVEDEVNVRKPLEDFLCKEGYQVLLANSLVEADEKIKGCPDLILLDWMLPDGQGIEQLKKWRHDGVHTPVILLTARADLVDKVLGLELGANDYVTKPFEPRELIARIRVQLRQNSIAQNSTNQSDERQLYESSGISINVKTHEALYLGKSISLAKTEFELLRVFLENSNQVFSREELLKQVWGYDQYPTTRTVDTHVHQLRQKTKSALFETVHGIGYRYRPEKNHPEEN
jgi:DNA-binding response OmpR family regulator